mgnify:CR=1 FL=1
MNIDDIVTITEIATDEDFDQTYATVFATSDYLVEPINNPRRGWPYSRLLAIGRYIFPYSCPAYSPLKYMSYTRCTVLSTIPSLK